MTGTRITRVEILEDFNKYDGEKGRNLPPLFSHDNARGLIGYEIPSLPVGTVLDFDAPLILILGRNGSGKSTLISKIYMQIMFNNTNPQQSKPLNYMNIEFSGDETPLIQTFYGGNKPSGLLTFNDMGNDIKEEKIALAKMSTGQYQWHMLEKYFDRLNRMNSSTNIASLDQPEHDLDILAKPEMIALLCNYIKKNGNQAIVVTHEKRFLKVHETHGIDAKIINLLESPAKSYRIQDFNLANYLK